MIDITQSPYNCVGDDFTDNTAGINSALATGKHIYAPTGTYRTSGNHAIATTGQRVTGDGLGATTFKITSDTNPGFVLQTGTIGVGIADCAIVRWKPSSVGSGAYGISQPAVLEKAAIERVLLRGHNIGVLLTNTDSSIMRDVVVDGNKVYGVQHQSVSGNGQCQWTFERCLFVKNGSHGYYFQAAAGSGSNSLGEYVNVSTFSNSGCGLAFFGASASDFVSGVRVLGGFFGEDGFHEILLDTYGGQHRIANASMELVGRGNTGPQLATPASHSGAGILLGSSNQDVVVVGVRVNGASDDGIYSEAKFLNLTGSTFTNNGLSTLLKNGIHIAGGQANVVGNTSGNVGGSTSQNYGLYRDPSATVQNVGNLFMANQVAPTFP